MTLESKVYVSLEFTPNPNTLKYSVDRQLLANGAANFTSKSDAEQRSPLAAKLFAVPGISGVMLGKNFVTVTKAEGGDWDEVHKESAAIIERHLMAGEEIMVGQNSEELNEGGTEIERKIREILDNEIRPMVAMDGGDVEFESFDNGIVYLHLHGSCAGCPSATMTLKMGIEARLREALPEVKEVVSV